MYELLKLLVAIQKSKDYLYKSVEFKDGFKYALEFIKIHGIKSEYFNELRNAKAQIITLSTELAGTNKFHHSIAEGLREELQEEKKRNRKLAYKNTTLEGKSDIRKERDKYYSQRKVITKYLTNDKLSDEAKVKAALEYLKQIKEGKE